MEKDIMKQYLPKGYIIRGIENLCAWQKDINTLRRCMCTMFEKGMYLNSEMAKRMLRDIGPDSCRKAKYILPFVLDTWNITEDSGFNKVEVNAFNKPKVVLDGDIPSMRLRYHKDLISKLVLRNEGLYDPVNGVFTIDSDSVRLYECY